jgi:hypothetical protein
LTRTPVRSQQRFESRPSKAADTQPNFDLSGRTHAADTLSSTDWIRPHWSKSILVKVAIRRTQGHTRWSNHDNPMRPIRSPGSTGSARENLTSKACKGSDQFGPSLTSSDCTSSPAAAAMRPRKAASTLSMHVTCTRSGNGKKSQNWSKLVTSGQMSSRRRHGSEGCGVGVGSVRTILTRNCRSFQ